ncbi:four helix bundle protein [Pontibacter ummariensis]|uniref:Four helix bundle protein n=1 Tax=Pontibacter ummariensis TaxID=1610492 RepID=A0A239JKC6_9BACT|nr:four helix bundle protein [Pontibacter ummariensis]PRY07842.1 four helix bundle protein [Pontibacter ummariensis]SNT05868.1 four helix bundle protein [Pontibacter ummariensis]
MTHNFRELVVWKEAIQLAKEVHERTSAFPASEKFGLTSQINRAVVSVPSNIAEGSGRSTNKDFRNFLGFALGSSYELETQLLLAKEFGYLPEKQFEVLLARLITLQKKISSLKNKLTD